jgi:anti-anti-sigma factor
MGTAEFDTSALLVELGGEIDLANARPLGDALCGALDRTTGAMVVDLAAVSFIDSSGIAMMLRVHQYAENLERTLSWRGVAPGPARAFEICGVFDVLNIEPAPRAAR